MAEGTITEQLDRLLRAEHFDEEVRDAIRELGADCLDELKGLATGSGRGERGFLKSRAILSLANWPDTDVLDTLDEVLDEGDLDDCMRATMALGEIGTAGAVERLGAFADRADDDLALASTVRALGSIEGDYRVAATQVLQQVRTKTASDVVLTEIADVLSGG